MELEWISRAEELEKKMHQKGINLRYTYKERHRDQERDPYIHTKRDIDRIEKYTHREREKRKKEKIETKKQNTCRYLGQLRYYLLGAGKYETARVCLVEMVCMCVCMYSTCVLGFWLFVFVFPCIHRENL